MTTACNAPEPCLSITLRPAQEGDEAFVRALMRLGGMGFAADWQHALVAVDAADQPVGYSRVQQTGKGPHVAPVAVRPDYRGKGVGRLLMRGALEQQGYLKLVARGEVAGFYRSIGCREIPFDEISGDLEEDCGHCADRATCQPVAFIMEQEPSHG